MWPTCCWSAPKAGSRNWRSARRWAPAGRRIAGELLLESVTLGVLGGALGLGLAYGALRLLVAMAPVGLPRLDEISIDPPVLLFTLAISLLAGVLFGLIPVFKYAGPRIATALREGGRTLSQSRERHRARSTLVVVQVALALVLLIGSGLMIRTFQAMRHVQPGFTRPEEVQTLRISIPEAQVNEPEQVMRMQQEIQREDRAASRRDRGRPSPAACPWTATTASIRSYAEDHPYAEGKLPPMRRFKFVAPGFFETMGNPLSRAAISPGPISTSMTPRRDRLREPGARILGQPGRGAGQAHPRRHDRTVARDHRRGGG